MFKRVLLKLYGEAPAAGRGFAVDATRIHAIAAEIATVPALGVEIGIVGGGAITYMDRSEGSVSV